MACQAALAEYPQYTTVTSTTFPGTDITAAITTTTTGVPTTSPFLVPDSQVWDARGSNMNYLASPSTVLSELPPNDSNYYGLGYAMGPGSMASTTYTFSRPVINPVIHILMMAPATITVSGMNNSATVPIVLNKLAGNPLPVATGALISVPGGGGGGTCAGAGGPNPTQGCGSFQVIGTFTQLTLFHRNPAGSRTSDGYVVAVTVPVDFGDATTSYGGVSHTIYGTAAQGFYLGAVRPDGEAGMQSTVGADGDNLAGTNDEDGVASFPRLSTIMASYAVNVVVRSPTGRAGTLVGWVDFNRNGTFEAAEGASAAVAANSNGTTATLTWTGITVPTAGTAYARFRITDDAALTTAAATGTLSDGEVEDYRVTIAQASADLSISKTNTPSSGATDLPSDTLGSGSQTVYDVVVRNDGLDAANNSVVRDPTPTGLSACTVTSCAAVGGAVCPATPGNLLSAGGVVIPTFPANSSVTFKVTCTVN